MGLGSLLLVSHVISGKVRSLGLNLRPRRHILSGDTAHTGASMDRLPAHPPSLLLKMSWKCTFWCLPHPRGCHLTISLSVDPRLRLPSSCFLGHDPKGSLQTGEGTKPSTLLASHSIRNRFTSELTNSDMSHSHLNFLLLNYSHDTSFPTVVHFALSDSLCKSNCSFLKTLALVPKFLTLLSLHVQESPYPGQIQLPAFLTLGPDLLERFFKKKKNSHRTDQYHYNLLMFNLNCTPNPVQLTIRLFSTSPHKYLKSFLLSDIWSLVFNLPLLKQTSYFRKIRSH